MFQRGEEPMKDEFALEVCCDWNTKIFLLMMKEFDKKARTLKKKGGLSWEFKKLEIYEHANLACILKFEFFHEASNLIWKRNQF